MTDIAAVARANAISIEGKKDGLYQKKGADWVVRFTIQSADLIDALKDAPLGTRYAMALVEIDDNEQPKQRDAAGNDASAGEVESPAPHRRSASPTPLRKPVAPEQRLTRQSAIVCNEPSFWRFLNETCKALPRGCLVHDGPEAAVVVRAECGVKSRNEIIPGTPAGDRWDALYSRYVAWRDVPEMAS